MESMRRAASSGFKTLTDQCLIRRRSLIGVEEDETKGREDSTCNTKLKRRPAWWEERAKLRSKVEQPSRDEGREPLERMNGETEDGRSGVLSRNGGSGERLEETLEVLEEITKKGEVARLAKNV